jgi:hypothetical protein
MINLINNKFNYIILFVIRIHTKGRKLMFSNPKLTKTHKWAEF